MQNRNTIIITIIILINYKLTMFKLLLFMTKWYFNIYKLR